MVLREPKIVRMSVVKSTMPKITPRPMRSHFLGLLCIWAKMGCVAKGARRGLGTLPPGPDGGAPTPLAAAEAVAALATESAAAGGVSDCARLGARAGLMPSFDSRSVGDGAEGDEVDALVSAALGKGAVGAAGTAIFLPPSCTGGRDGLAAAVRGEAGALAGAAFEPGC